MIIKTYTFEELESAFEEFDIRDFTVNEFRCRCGHPKCPVHGIDPMYVHRVQGVRDIYGKPMRVNSGYRCLFHPIEARKSNPGTHPTGEASDFAVHGVEALLLMQAVFNFNEEYGEHFTGFGLNQKGAIEDRFLHLDTAEATPYRPRPWSWTY